MSRPMWDEYFMEIARVTAKRSTCDRAIVGAVLVKDRSIIAAGYNGAPSKLMHCGSVGHLMVDGHCARTVHAEMNAIIQAAQHNVSTTDATCYVTHFPCFNCTKVLINAGITRIVYDEEYRMDENAIDFLLAANVKFDQLKSS